MEIEHLPPSRMQLLFSISLILGGCVSACENRERRGVMGEQESLEGREIPLFDTNLAADAEVVLRVRLVEDQGGSKYHWQVVEKLAIIKNEGSHKMGNRVLVAHYGWEPGIPAGVSTIYLNPYSELARDRWRLVDGSAKSGVSHRTGHAAEY